MKQNSELPVINGIA